MNSNDSSGFDENCFVSVQDLSYQYSSGVFALSSISFKIKQGERVGLIGPSGAGKSTLLLHLNGLLPEKNLIGKRLPLSPVTIAGREMRTANLPEIRQQVGLLFQNPDDQLFCPTVEEDVAFGPQQMELTDAECEQRVSQALEEVGLIDLRSRPVSQLSYGQKKRACLAGLFTCQPKLLALDEPFSGLDPRARNSLKQLLVDFAGTLIIATHDLDVVLQMCDRVLLLDQGVVQATGPTKQILGDAKLMENHGLEVPLRLEQGARGQG